MKKISSQEFIIHIVNGGKCIDVRAPIEFSQGCLPNSINFPLLDDKERSAVGTCYKQQGQDAAIKLGHKLVSGENKNKKINLWKNYLIENPNTVITCFRGGLRSQTTQLFLKENGIDTIRVDGGYKLVRQSYLDTLKHLNPKNSFSILTGETGSAKTEMIRQLKKLPVVDLEKFAEHKGSAFGKTAQLQPSQGTFENKIAQKLIEIEFNFSQNNKIIFEDESRCIGSLHLPENLFTKMRSSSVVQIAEPLESRINHIYSEYITDDFLIYDYFKQAIGKIQKKLGGLRSQELLNDIENSRIQHQTSNTKFMNKIWIEKLLVWYYDPLYQSSFKIRAPVVEFKGRYDEVKDYLQNSQLIT